MQELKEKVMLAMVSGISADVRAQNIDLAVQTCLDFAEAFVSEVEKRRIEAEVKEVEASESAEETKAE